MESKPRRCRRLGFAIMPTQLPGVALLQPDLIRMTVSETVEPLPQMALAAPLFQSPDGRAHPLPTRIQICSHSTDDRSIGVPKDATLAAVARKNSGRSKSDTRAAKHLAARIEVRSACPLQERHR